MAVKKKYKRLTNKEKEQNKQFKKLLIEEGIITQPKQRLNRKKFIEETEELWKQKPHCYIWDMYIRQAIYHMILHKNADFKTSLEAIGAAKVLRIALKLQELEEQLKKDEIENYTMEEQIKAIMEIKNA